VEWFFQLAWHFDFLSYRAGIERNAKESSPSRLASHYLGIIEIRTSSYGLLIVGIIDYATQATATRTVAELSLRMRVKVLIAGKRQKTSASQEKTN